MKKVLVFICAIVLVLCTSVSAFALSSKEGEPKYNVEFSSNASGEYKAGTNTVKTSWNAEKTEVTITKQTSQYKFFGWAISGIEGVDYLIVSGDKNSETIVIKPLTDKVKIKEVFVTPSNPNPSLNYDDEGKAPKTGDNTVYVAVMLALIAAGAFVTAKKSVKA